MCATGDQDEDSDTGTAPGGTVVIGLVADPGMPTDIAERLRDRLPEWLAARVGDRIDWRLHVVSEEIALDAHGRMRIIEKARETKPAEGWDVLVALTDLPRRDGTRPIVADLNTTHQAALVSLPAVGWIRMTPHVRDTIVHLIDLLYGDPGDSPPRSNRALRRPAELASPVRRVPAGREDIDVHLALTGTRGQLRLLFGMVRDNRPWRLVPSMSRAIAAASGAAAFGIFYPTVWGMADALSSTRLALISLFAVCAMAVWLIAQNSLWERPRMRVDRNKALLYNAASVLTMVLGVACMYVLLFTITLLAAGAVIADDYLRVKLGHPVGVTDYATLAWLSSSLGTVAGALGSSLETEDAVRRAAFSRRERERRAQHRDEDG